MFVNTVSPLTRTSAGATVAVCDPDFAPFIGDWLLLINVESL